MAGPPPRCFNLLPAGFPCRRWRLRRGGSSQAVIERVSLDDILSFMREHQAGHDFRACPFLLVVTDALLDPGRRRRHFE
jgi:hypothetical protein